MRCKAFEALIGTVLHASVCQCAPPLDNLLLFSFFSLLAVYLKVLMLEYLQFSHTTGSLYYDG